MNSNQRIEQENNCSAGLAGNASFKITTNGSIFYSQYQQIAMAWEKGCRHYSWTSGDILPFRRTKFIVNVRQTMALSVAADWILHLRNIYKLAPDIISSVWLFRKEYVRDPCGPSPFARTHHQERTAAGTVNKVNVRPLVFPATVKSAQELLACRKLFYLKGSSAGSNWHRSRMSAGED